MNESVKKLWNAVSFILVVIIIILAVLLAGVRVIGYRPLSVLSGSMEPTYHVGSLIYVKSVDYRELKPGDVITFMIDEDTLATHRIIEVVPDETDPTVLRFRTQGDANKVADETLVHYRNVVGTPRFTIPKMGYFANFAQNPPGMYIVITAALVLIILFFLPDMLKKADEADRKAAEEKEKEKEQKAE